MPRPKGSKNKKTLNKDYAVLIAEQETAIKTAEESIAEISQSIESHKAQIKDLKKTIRTAKTKIAALTSKKEEAARAAESAEISKEIEKKVSELIKNGVSRSEIMDALSKM